MLKITAYTTTSALGLGRNAALNALRQGLSGLTPNDFSETRLATWIGRVRGVEEVLLPEGLERFECRNHQLATLAIHQDGLMEAVAEARERYGPRRVGVFLGTSTSGIGHTESAYRVPATISNSTNHSLIKRCNGWLTPIFNSTLVSSGIGSLSWCE